MLRIKVHLEIIIMSIKRLFTVAVALLGLLVATPMVTTAVAQACNPCSGPK